MSYLAKNKSKWNETSSDYQKLHESQLGIVEPTWGVWALREKDLQILGDVAGEDVLEFGCGGAQWSVALAKRGARVVGIDLSAQQLEHARTLVKRERVEVTLIEANAEHVPLPDASFDIVFCDHGAMTFADPTKTVPEAARLLRPGGLFAFNHSAPLLELAYDPNTDTVGDRLLHDYFELKEIESDGMVTFQLPHGAWIRLFRESGFMVEDLIELRPPENASTTYAGYAPLGWARRFPAEEIWKLRKR